jgi:hypothetical protein
LAATVANASTSQCLVDAREESDKQGPEFDAADSADEWVRVEAAYITIEKKPEKEKKAQKQVPGFYVGSSPKKGEKAQKQVREFYVGSDPFNQGETFCYVGDRWDVREERNAKRLGEKIGIDDIENLLENEGWIKTSETRRKVLAMFTEGEENGFIKGLEYKGLYPNEQRTANTGAVSSCLCSVDPDYRATNMCG